MTGGTGCVKAGVSCLFTGCILSRTGGTLTVKTGAGISVAMIGGTGCVKAGVSCLFTGCILSCTGGTLTVITGTGISAVISGCINCVKASLSFACAGCAGAAIFTAKGMAATAAILRTLRIISAR